jgi:hypothetical protein
LFWKAGNGFDEQDQKDTKKPAEYKIPVLIKEPPTQK